MQTGSTHFLTRPEKRLWSVLEVLRRHFSRANPTFYQRYRADVSSRPPSSQPWLLIQSSSTTSTVTPSSSKQWGSTPLSQGTTCSVLLFCWGIFTGKLLTSSPNDTTQKTTRREGGGGCLAGEKQRTSDTTSSCQLDVKLLRVYPKRWWQPGYSGWWWMWWGGCWRGGCCVCASCVSLETRKGEERETERGERARKNKKRLTSEWATEKETY